MAFNKTPRQFFTSLLSGGLNPNQGNTAEVLFVALGPGADPLPHSDIGLRLRSLAAGHTTPHVFLEPHTAFCLHLFHPLTFLPKLSYLENNAKIPSNFILL